MDVSLYNCSFVTLRSVGVLCLMKPAVGRFCAAVMQYLFLYPCLLFTQMWAGGVIYNMNNLVW